MNNIKSYAIDAYNESLEREEQLEIENQRSLQ